MKGLSTAGIFIVILLGLSLLILIFRPQVAYAQNTTVGIEFVRNGTVFHIWNTKTLGAEEVLNDTGLAQSSQVLNKNRTLSSEKACVRGACDITLYSGIAFTRDGKRIEEAESLKGEPINIEIEQDNDFPVTVIDYNMTHITIDTSSSNPTNVFRDAFFRIREKENETNILFEEKVTLPLVQLLPTRRQIDLKAIDRTQEWTIYGVKFSWGIATTNITLSDNITELLEDGALNQDSAATEYGLRNLMQASGGNTVNNQRWAAIKWNISAVPAGQVIVNATLTFRVTGHGLDAGETLNVSSHGILSPPFNISGGVDDWVEGTGGSGGATCSGSDLCWNTRPLLANGEYNGTPSSTIQYTSSTTVPRFDTWDVTSIIQNCYEVGIGNCSIVLIPVNNSGNPAHDEGPIINTKDHATSTVRPILNISYEPVAAAAGVSITNQTRSCSTFTNVTTSATSANWTTIGNANVSDDAYASIVAAGAGQSSFLQVTNCGFTLPTNATILGIQVTAERSETVALIASDGQAKIVKAGTIQTNSDHSNTTAYPTGDTVTYYGNTSDLWSQTWTYEEVNAPNFGFALSTNFTGITTANIDVINMTVYYNETGLGWSGTGTWVIECSQGGTISQNANLNGNDILFNNSGTISVYANITNFTTATSKICHVYTDISQGGELSTNR